MSERAWRNVFFIGTAIFFAIFLYMSWDSLYQVEAGRTPPVTDLVAKGKAVWNARNCNDCHTILGIGGYFAPDLTKVADRRDVPWIISFLTDPQGTKPGTTMPNQHLLAEEADETAAFLEWVDGVNTNGWPPNPLGGPRGGGTAVAGVLLVQQKGCVGCHKIEERGSASGPGPDLSHVGSRLDAADISRFIQNPQAVRPGSPMPRIPMSGPEADTIAAYLASLK